MRLSNPAQSLLLLFVPVLFFFGCSSGGNENREASLLISERGPAIPFATSEPERYRADVVVKTGDTERSFTIARDGERRRTDYDVGRPRHRAVIKADREYLIDFDGEIFAVAAAGRASTSDNEFVMNALNRHRHTEFIEAGTEDGLSVYQAEIHGAPASEISIYIDPATNLPMKQEFYSIEGDRRQLVYSVELQGVSLDVEADLFRVPAGFREVSVKEFRRRSR